MRERGREGGRHCMKERERERGRDGMKEREREGSYLVLQSNE
jgi:hypothetical protein